MGRILILVLMLTVATLPLYGQIDQKSDSRLQLKFNPEVLSYFHQYETGFAWGGRLGFENDRWTFGLATYQFINNLDTDPAPKGSLGPDNLVVTADHYKNIEFYGFFVGRTIKTYPALGTRLHMMLGAVSMVRRKEAYEIIGYDNNGIPVNLGDIGTGREIHLFLEPTIKIERKINGRLNVGLNTGYLLSVTRLSSDDFQFNTISLRLGLAYQIF